MSPTADYDDGLISSTVRHSGNALQAQNSLPAWIPFLATRFTMAAEQFGQIFSKVAAGGGGGQRLGSGWAALAEVR